MEENPLSERVGLEKNQNFDEFLMQNHRFRRVAYGLLAVWSAGVSIAGINSIHDEDMTAYNSESLAYIDGINKLTTGELASQEETVPKTLTSPDEGIPEIVPTTIQMRPAEKLGLELDPRVEEAMSGLEGLSLDGYDQFLQSIDTSPVAYSQQFREFNPDLLQADIAQGPSEIFVLHFTVKYANDEPGFGDMSIGNFNVGNLIKSMAARFGHDGQCCASNWGIGRHATTHQMAPLNAKLNHNPPYDSVSTSAEVEADEQASITTGQYMELAYLSVGVLDTQERLGKFPLNEILKGHGEMRDLIIDEWNRTYPSHKLGVRDDFNFPESELFRYYVQKFLDKHPEVIGRRPFTHLQ